MVLSLFFSFVLLKLILAVDLDSYKSFRALNTLNESVNIRYVSKNVLRKSMLKNLKSVNRSINFSGVACLIYLNIIYLKLKILNKIF